MNKNENDPKNLDERLRAAHQRQLTRTKLEVEGVQFLEEHTTLALGPRVLAAAAAVLIVGLGSLGLVRLLGNDNPNIEATGTPEPTTAHDTTTQPDIESTTSDTNGGSTLSTVVSTSPTSSDIAGNESEPGDPGVTTSTAAAPGDRTTTAPPTSEPDQSTDTPLPVATAAGVANTVCPTGKRAALERATLSYIGQNEGWGRLNDLVDEQDGPHYFEAWEPGYPNPVTVLVVLDQPVVASEIRVAQDPFTPVAGTITLEAMGQEFALELEGTDGWAVAGFTSQVLDRFTITRSDRQSNVMEVLVCVDPGAD